MNQNPIYEKPTIAMGRIKWIYLVLGLIFVFYVYRLFTEQIINGATYRAAADDNRTQVISDPTERGMIFDRNGVVLARNVPSFNITITPAGMPDPDDNAGQLHQLVKELSEVISMPASNGVLNEETAKSFSECNTDFGIEQIVTIAGNNWPFRATRLKCDVSKEVAMIVQEKAMDWPGVSVEVQSIREYPTGVDTAEVVGFLGPIPESQVEYYTGLGFVSGRDKVGYAGLEQSMQDVLGGVNGTRVVEVNVGGQVMRNLEEPVEPVNGGHIYTTIDYRLQAIARQAMIDQFNYYNNLIGKVLSDSGVTIVMKVKTGEILALVNYPSFENNRMSRFIPAYYYNQLSSDEAKPLLNKAISSEVPPGSVYKLVSALGILNEKVIDEWKHIEDPGIITLLEKYYPNDPGSPRTFKCWQPEGHGAVDYLRAIAWSCNVYWYKVGGGFENEVPGDGLGIWRMSEYAKALGYGEVTGVELPGEVNGLNPNPTWKRLNIGENWATGDTYLATVGQGYVLSTPMQVINSISTIANDGKRMQPTVIYKIMDDQGNVVKALEPKMVVDITKTPLIHEYNGNIQLETLKAVEPWILAEARKGMELVTKTFEPESGTAAIPFENVTYSVAGKTGTAEYCDDFALKNKLCGVTMGYWPAHGWFVGYAPADDPEVVVLNFSYNGTEGSRFSAPIVRRVLDAYFELKSIDAGTADQGEGPTTPGQ